jgi:bacterioferritin-associated ferredoxin
MILVRSFRSRWGGRAVIVCSCFNVSDRTVRALAGAGATLEATLVATRAGASCGACRHAIARIHAGAPAEAPPCRLRAVAVAA